MEESKVGLYTQNMVISFLPSLKGTPLQSAARMMSDSVPATCLKCVNWPEVYDYCPEVSVRLAHDGERLYACWHVRDEIVRAEHQHDLEQVCEDSCCELFVKQPDGPLYTNLEFNCLGVSTASRRRERKVDVTRFTPEEFARISRYSSLSETLPPHSAALLPQSYTLCISLPWDLVGADSRCLPDNLWLNVYKCGDKTLNPHFVSLFPITVDKPDFHRPDYFQSVPVEK